MRASLPGFAVPVLAALLCALATVSCTEAGPEFQPYAKARGPRTMTVGGTEVTVEVSETGVKRRQGLMNRDSMPENHGMLFVYAQPQIMRFWMKNTYIPLDIAFIETDGTITNIEQMPPLQETPGAVSIREVPYALEMNVGWFQKHGVRPGDKIELPEWLADVIPE